ncbi:MAG: SGNH/GDSL hydrolase family protein, partial [Rhizobacter sp.]|nr:SGNH/GDSL hydrolase family protein [Chlorobiales bacterium]
MIAQVRAKLPAGDEATLLAIDGSINTDVAAQVKRLTKLTPSATHLFISSGGNDALQNSNVFFVPVQHVG